MSSIKLKRFIGIYTGNSISDGDKDKYTIQNENTIPYISTKDIEAGSNKVDYYNDMYIDILKNPKFKIADKNSILLCIEGGSAGKKITQVNQRVCFVNKLCCFNPSKEYNKQFVYFYLQSDLFLSQFKLNVTGLIGGVSQSIIKEFNIPFYSIDLQEKIANYLDNKTSKIDQTIKDNKKEIELLEEYKNSVLGKTLKKYDTKVVKLKYLIKNKLQYGANSSGTLYDEKLPRYVRITDIEDERLKTKDMLSLTEDEAKDFILIDGDILFARSGGTVGKTFQYFRKFGKCAFAGYLIRAQFYEKNLAKYVYNFTSTCFYKNWKDSIFIQSTIQNIGADKYSNMPVIMPSDENLVLEINKKVEEEMNKMNSIIEHRQQIINKLQEYKKSL
ncbi:MAG: restriction endonuclease subunit S, partial [Clostridia bacterium]